MKILKRLLVNLFGILILVTTVSMMTPNSSFLQSYLEAAGLPGIEFPAEPPAEVEPFSSAFHFLEPIAPATGDPSKFDPSLLKHLKVEVCEVGLNGCTLIKTFTSQSASSDQLRITFTGGYGNFYIANWDTKKSNFSTRNTYRVSVSAAGILLGSVDLTPAMYSGFGRTWPIKFMIEKNAELRMRLFDTLGKSCAQMAAMLKYELELDEQAVRTLLAADPPACSQPEIDVAVAGVFQDVVIPPTTKISDESTRDALTLFDPVSGIMVFSLETTLLKNLKINDVLVSEPGPGAPFGYLRKVKLIQKSRSTYTLQTIQAKLTDAVYKGTLVAAGDLLPADESAERTTSARKTIRNEDISAELVIDEGESFNFGPHHIDETINFDGSQNGVTGTGKVRVVGDVFFDARYNVGAGIRGCLAIPPACVDRFEAWAGAKQRSKLRVEGDFNGTINKEKVVHPIPLNPIWFFIGPIPVVLVPEMNIVLGVHGDAHVDFVFDANANSTFKVGAKWLNPDYGGNGWNDISEYDLFSGRVNQAEMNANMRLEAYAKLDATIKLYGIVGPGMEGSVGIEADVATGRQPLWTLRGHVLSAAKFEIGLAEIIDVGVYREPILNEYFFIAESVNAPPVFSDVRAGPIPARIDRNVEVGPGGVFGVPRNYSVSDPEGGEVALSVSAPGGVVISQNPLRVRYGSPGLKTVTITATDPEGLPSTLSLGVDVRNSPPIVTVTPASGEVSAKTQYWLSASAYDPEEGDLPCSRLTWSASGSHTLSKSSSNRTCTAVVKFNDLGANTVTVSAVDSQGTGMNKTVNVFVTPAPANLLPEIEVDSFSITAESTRFFSVSQTEICLPGSICEVPEGGLLYNGEDGDFLSPLILRLTVSDPDGDPVAVEWHCQTGSQFAPITYNGDGSYSCSPIYSPTEPIKVYADVGPPAPLGGDTTDIFGVRSAERTFYMLQRIN